MSKVKIDIVSGFLGAGKTTLIKKLLADAFKGEQVVLIENEFGEIGIDGGFLKESGIEIREMNSGCICCSLVGDFGASLQEVVTTYHPDRILIEPSGVGKLSDVIKAVQGVQAENEDMVLNSYTTVVDAKKCKMYLRNFGEFFNNQVQFAGAIVMSRTDIIDEAKTEEALAILRGLNDKAVIITTPIEQLEGKKILDVIEHPVSLEQQMLDEEKEGFEDEHHHHHHDEDEEHEHHHHHDEDEEHEHHHHHDEDEEHEHHHHHDEDEEHEHHHHHDEGEEHEHHHHHEEHEHHHHHDEDEEHEHHHDHHGHHHHHADEVFQSWGRETVKKFTKESLQEKLKALDNEELYGTVLRAKGMLPAEDGTWIYFDMVPEETVLREGAADFTGRLCVIGAKLNEKNLSELFGL